QALKVRSRSRDCLWQIQLNGDESVQAEIVNAGFIGVMIIAISAAGGSEEDETDETYDWLKTSPNSCIICVKAENQMYLTEELLFHLNQYLEGYVKKKWKKKEPMKKLNHSQLIINQEGMNMKKQGIMQKMPNL
ncbi:MAG: hypothetical protein EZS28_034767, partial [Streblomastix strix]